MRPTILLFDLDGTLVSTGGAGRRAIERAFTSLFADRGGAREACGHFSFAGMTDRAIARAGLQALHLEPSEAEIARVLARYVELLDEELAPAAAPKFRVLSGVPERSTRRRAPRGRDLARHRERGRRGEEEASASAASGSASPSAASPTTARTAPS
jgi:phosphoglycolate phosphatase-like HAD superfamily hydrolase